MQNKSPAKTKALRNRTMALSESDIVQYQRRLLNLSGSATARQLENRTINQDLFEVLDWLPPSFVDLLFIDPPYNLTKSFNTHTFRERSSAFFCVRFILPAIPADHTSAVRSAVRRLRDSPAHSLPA